MYESTTCDMITFIHYTLSVISQTRTQGHFYMAWKGAGFIYKGKFEGVGFDDKQQVVRSVDYAKTGSAQICRLRRNRKWPDLSTM